MADDTMANNTTANNIHIPNDIWRYYALSRPPDGTGFRDLRNIRGVSHFTLDTVDQQLGPGDLRTRLQARGTLYCQAHLNHHIQTDHRALASAMEDLLEDEHSQLTILQSLPVYIEQCIACHVHAFAIVTLLVKS